MTQRRSQKGRTLLEMLAVLAIIAILSICGLLGYSFLVHRWKKLESVKAVETLALRQKTTPVISDDYVKIKTLYPEAERSAIDIMKLPDSAESKVQLKSFARNSFVVEQQQMLVAVVLLLSTLKEMVPSVQRMSAVPQGIAQTVIVAQSVKHGMEQHVLQILRLILLCQQVLV